jgi:hypothetical protein
MPYDVLVAALIASFATLALASFEADRLSVPILRRLFNRAR